MMVFMQMHCYLLQQTRKLSRWHETNETAKN